MVPFAFAAATFIFLLLFFNARTGLHIAAASRPAVAYAGAAVGDIKRIAAPGIATMAINGRQVAATGLWMHAGTMQAELNATGTQPAMQQSKALAGAIPRNHAIPITGASLSAFVHPMRAGVPLVRRDKALVQPDCPQQQSLHRHSGI
ncbi:hypothetical protein ASD58_05315 [Duganella sp. Root1480D1]|nr:hypothetical protein ASD58_05315 [Duganella sp. Root1480D1]